MKITTNKNDYYCIRFRVHKQLIPYFKKSVISKSLKTKHRKTAQIRANQLYFAYNQLLSLDGLIEVENLVVLVNHFIEVKLKQNLITHFTHKSKKYVDISNYVTIQEAYDKFYSWYKQQGLTDKDYMATTNKLNKTIIPFLGGKTLIEDITLEVIEEFQEFLLTFPNVSKKQYKNMTFNQIIKLSNIPHEDMIGVSTQIKYLKILKQFFAYTIKADIIKYNPCTLLTMPNNTISNREPFDNEDMKKIFSIIDSIDDTKYIY